MPQQRIAYLLPFFTPREVPERATTPEEMLRIPGAMQRVESGYERFRNLLDPGDEDILRRKAIVRFLRRRWELGSEPETLALALLKELASGRYIPENTHRRYAVDIAHVVDRAFRTWQGGGRRTHRSFFPFVAVEIDRVLYPREADDALVYAFFEDVLERVIWDDPSVADGDRHTQLFLACHRALASADDAELFWHLFRATEPAWTSDAGPEDLVHVAEHYGELEGAIERSLRHPAAVRLLRKLQPPAVPYRMLREVLRREDADVVLSAPDLLAAGIREVLSRRIRRLEGQLLRRVWHAALFLFLSKGILALVLEIPYELFLGGLRVVPLFINLMFPPTLLFLMTGSVPRPGKANTERLLEVLQIMVSGDGQLPEIVLRAPQKNALRRTVFALLYACSTILLFGGIIWVLRTLHFSLVGGFFFLVFLALVSFLGLRLRASMRELRIVAPREGIVSALIDFFTLPIVDLGRQIVLHASQINVFLFVLDAIIEAPFKVLIGLVEEWFAYLREKKEELV